MSLADALEGAASALTAHADVIRPANGDPMRLLDTLDETGAQAVLRWLLEERPDDASELADAWSEEAPGVAAILAVSGDGLPKPARKALRRLHHQLRSRGIETPTATPAPTVARLADVDDRLSGAYLTPLDPSGARMAYLLESHPQGGARLFEIILDEERGVLRFDVYSAGRKKTREFLKAIGQSDRMPALEVDPANVKALVARALTRHDAEAPVPKGLSEWRSHVVDEAAPTPGQQVADALEVGDAADAVARCAALVDEGELGPWPANPAKLDAVVERLRNAVDSPLIVSGATKRDQLDDVVADAATEVYDDETAAIAAIRLRESAWAFWRQDQEEHARACLGAAAAFEAGAPRENPVALAMLRTVLGPALAQLQAQQAAEAAPDDEAAGEDAPLIVEP